MQREIPVGDGAQWQEALETWDRRRDLREAERAVDLFEELADFEDDNPDAAAWIARSAYFQGDYQEDTNAARRCFERGWKAGRQALELDPSHIGGLFWTGVCLAAHADLVNLVRRAGFVPEILKYMRQVWDREPSYFHRGPARLLGQAIVRQPGLVSKFLPLAIPDVGPDTTLRELERAIEEGPPVVLTYQTLGQLSHAVVGDRETPRRMLEALEGIDLDAAEDLAPENHLDLDRARRLLRELI